MKTRSQIEAAVQRAKEQMNEANNLCQVGQCQHTIIALEWVLLED